MGLILVANTKGGCGKSTSAIHLVAPWVLSRIGAANVVELDDENTDTADFSNSKIKTKRLPLGKDRSSYLAVEKLIEQAMTERIIVDIGGNRTCTLTLRNLSEMGADDDIELIIVPVASPGRDVDNAANTIDQIRSEIRNYKGPIVLVISRTSSTDLGIVERENPEAFELAVRYEMKGPIILPDDRLFSGARKLNLSAWEISENIDQLSKMVSDMKSLSKESRDVGLHREAQRLNAIIVAGRNMRPHLDSQFDKLDGILNLSNSTGSEDTASKASKPTQQQAAKES